MVGFYRADNITFHNLHVINVVQDFEVWRINFEGCKNVCVAALENNIQKMVYTSTVSTVGSGTADRPADEKSTFDGKKTCDYWESKIAAENSTSWVIAVRDAPPSMVRKSSCCSGG